MKDIKFRISGLLLLLAFCFLQPLAAQEKSGAAASLHSLWKVEGKSNTVYLLGSVHLLKAENFPLAPPLEAAFSNAAVVVFETDIEKMEDPQLQMKMMAKAQLPEGETLKDHLSAETYTSFTSHLKDSGLPPEMFNSMKPAMAAIVLGMVELTKLGADPEHGLDKYFSKRVRKEGKEVVGLESIDFQLNLLTSFSREEDELVMKSSLKDIDSMKEKYGDMVKAWQNGDGAGLDKMLNEMLREAPSIHKRLLTDRNKSWIPKIEELLHGEKNAIVIVGAGHLVGTEGVVELLKKKGLKVTQQ